MKNLFHASVLAGCPGHLKKSLAAAFLLFIAHCSLFTLSAQTPEPADVLRIDADLVNLNISIFSRIAAGPGPPLQQKDFAILDNGVLQEISFFASSDAPFDLVLLLDLSGSTAEKIDLIRKSSKRFVDAVRPGDRVAVVTFSADIQTISTFTSDRTALKKSIDRIEKPVGGTNFWDASRFVVDHIVSQSRVERRRSAVIVMTDGVDNALPDVFGEGSKTTFEELLEAGRRSETIILPIYLDTEPEANFRSTPPWAYKMAREQLAMLAAESGNTPYYARKVKDLDGVYAQVIRDLSTVYSIGYRPTNRGRAGAWHAVNVQVITRPDLAVRAKRGYYESR